MVVSQEDLNQIKQAHEQWHKTEPEPEPEPEPQPGTKLQILRATASEHDGNIPSNVIDGNQQTRWSALVPQGGIQFITLEFCKSKITRIEIDWFQGIPPNNTRKANYHVTDSIGTVVFQGSSSGTAVLPVNIAETKRIFIKCTGTNINQWASIIEVRLFGTKLENCVLQPEPEPEPEPIPEPGPVIIEGGVKMMYPRKEGTVPITFTFGSSNTNRAQWRANLGRCIVNEETTAYYKIAQVVNLGEEISHKHRGNGHGDENPERGSCYIAGVKYTDTGETKGVNCQYEEPHPNNHSMPFTRANPPLNPGNIIGKWIGVKTVVYLQGDHDKIECYLDLDGLKPDGTPANNWKLFWSTISRQFTGRCTTPEDNMTFLRLDDIPDGHKGQNVEMKFGTTREIVPPTS